MKTTIITLYGKARHGKDTFADAIISSANKQGLSAIKIGYEDIMKDIATRYYGWDGNKDDAGRTLLQLIGNALRKENPNFLIDHLFNLVSVLIQDYDVVIVPDCRFPVEIHNLSNLSKVKSLDFRCFKLTRPDFQNDLTDEQSSHPSEIALDDFKSKNSDMSIRQIFNTSIESLQTEATVLVKYIINNINQYF